MQAAHPGEEVEVWFGDEARFGQKGALTRARAERGSRPAAPKQGGFKGLQVLTGVRPATGRAEGLIAERLNSAVAQLFLDRPAAAIPAGAHVLLARGGAGWHTAKALRAPPNVTLLRLPAYGPELNPVERLWLYLREHHRSNRPYAGLGELEQAAVDGWRAVCLQPEKVRSICRCRYAETGS